MTESQLKNEFNGVQYNHICKAIRDYYTVIRNGWHFKIKF